MRLLESQRQRAPSPATLRRMASTAIRNRKHGALRTLSVALVAPPRQPLPHEVPLSPEEIRFAIVKGICREPRDDEVQLS